ncbi:hypothetical protein G7077_08805 [Sphingomonas piscis]|uniref:Uncharacterized protein n=1 Tax=Sphingomonas piscis TaxID=2714943 RepID=A0A6G7YQG4_9SPHN|nr:DUF6491 family protein [Sphingomonas piscis]QIK78981.1 hypothetical protein G7077_08805 [Sphingomonas piscis]
MISRLTLAASTALLCAVPATSQPLPPQAAIHHANNGGIRDWYASNDAGLYLRDRTNRWYYAQFTHRCPGVLDGMTVLFDTHGDHRFDRSSTVRTKTMTCAVRSLVRTQAPAEKGGRHNNIR